MPPELPVGGVVRAVVDADAVLDERALLRVQEHHTARAAADDPHVLGGDGDEAVDAVGDVHEPAAGPEHDEALTEVLNRVIGGVLEDHHGAGRGV